MSMKDNYNKCLLNLITDDTINQWAFVKMIDFAHVFPNEDGLIDSNYVEGINNLVKLFEDFLNEEQKPVNNNKH